MLSHRSSVAAIGCTLWPWAALCANVSETVAPLEIRVEGGAKKLHDDPSRDEYDSGCRSGFQGTPAAVQRQVQVGHSQAGVSLRGPRAVQKLIAGIVEGFRDDAPFRLARSHRETRPTLGLLARISVRHRTVMASTVRHAARRPVRPLVAGNNAMPNLEDRSVASCAGWHSPLRPDQADCRRARLLAVT